MAGTADLPAIQERLADVFGHHTWEPDLDPLSELVSNILGQQTGSATSRRAFAALRERFPTWEAVCDAEPAAIAGAIRCAGLANVKAPRLKRLLAQVAAERGELSLDFLGQLPVREALAWLRRLPGVGQNSAACTVLFGLGRPAMPVDGAILRIARRLGLVRYDAGADEVQAALEGGMAEDGVYTLHIDLIRFGRQICTATHPRCEACPLNDLCDYFTAARTPNRER